MRQLHLKKAAGFSKTTKHHGKQSFAFGKYGGWFLDG